MKNATINVRKLRVRTFNGYNPEERLKKQDIVITMEIEHLVSEGIYHDDVDSALNYKTITKRVIDFVEQGRFLLLEKLVADIVDQCSQHPRVRRCRVTVDKPHALRFADSVALTLEHSKYEQGALSDSTPRQEPHLIGIAS